MHSNWRRSTTKVIDLFCGAGGFSEGFRQAGCEIILGIDNDSLACETYYLNQNTQVWYSNVEDIHILPYADVIIGSPPCPEYSNANRSRRPHDKPNTKCLMLFFEIIEKQKPKYWMMENVPNSQKYIPEQYRKYIQIIQANWHGLPHERQRLFVGNLPKIHPGKRVEVRYPTPMASDCRPHNSKKNIAQGHSHSLCDYFGCVPDINVFKRLMGFPDDYVFVGRKTDQIKQIGNAVCPPVAKAIAEAILKGRKP